MHFRAADSCQLQVFALFHMLKKKKHTVKEQIGAESTAKISVNLLKREPPKSSGRTVVEYVRSVSHEI